MYFEIYHQRKLIKRGRDALNVPTWSNELMYIPTTEIQLPIYYREFLNGHDEMKIFINGKCFWGIIEELTEDKNDETISVGLEHVIREWEYRQISVNNAIKDQNINVVFKGSIVEKNDSGVSVTGNDFTIYTPEVGNMTLEQYIERCGASAWEENGDPVEITSVDDSAVKIIPDDYEVTFFTANGDKVTVTMTVRTLPRATTREYDGVTVCATKFELAYGEHLTQQQYIERAYAIAWDTEGNVIPIAMVNAEEVLDTPGSYTVRYIVDADYEDYPRQYASISVVRLPEGEEPDDPFPYIKPWIMDPSIVDELADIYSDMNFAYSGWIINYEHGADDHIIDYVYSRQNKLDALSKTVELTEDLFWRVRFVNERAIDVSPFGDQKQWIISTKPSGINNIRLISEPVITHDFSNVINVATVYAEKNDTGVSSMTLREIYNDPSLQEEGFPVIILRANVNNERDYRMYSTQYPKLAPNNELEFAIVDEESVALESGTIIEGTFAFNDLSPFQIETDDEGRGIEVSDEDRIEAAKTAYHAAIRRLKLSRRTYKIKIEVEEVPAALAPGDKVRLIYDNSLYILDECSAYQKKILSMDDWFYITGLDYNFNDDGVETDVLTLEKYLRIDRETSTE